MTVNPAKLSSTRFARSHITMHLDIHDPASAPDEVAAELIELADLLARLVKPWREARHVNGVGEPWFVLDKIVEVPNRSVLGSPRLLGSLELADGNLVVGDALGLGEGEHLDMVPGLYEITLLHDVAGEVFLQATSCDRIPDEYHPVGGWGSDVGLMALSDGFTASTVAHHGSISRHNPSHGTLAAGLIDQILPGRVGIVRVAQSSQFLFAGALSGPGDAKVWVGTNRADQAVGVRIRLAQNGSGPASV